MSAASGNDVGLVYNAAAIKAYNVNTHAIDEILGKSIDRGSGQGDIYGSRAAREASIARRPECDFF